MHATGDNVVHVAGNAVLDLLVRGVAPEGPALVAAPAGQGGVALRF